MSRQGECDVCGKDGELYDTVVCGTETAACGRCLGHEHEPDCSCQDCCDGAYVPDEQDFDVEEAE